MFLHVVILAFLSTALVAVPQQQTLQSCRVSGFMPPSLNGPYIAQSQAPTEYVGAFDQIIKTVLDINYTSPGMNRVDSSPEMYLRTMVLQLEGRDDYYGYISYDDPFIPNFEYYNGVFDHGTGTWFNDAVYRFVHMFNLFYLCSSRQYSGYRMARRFRTPDDALFPHTIGFVTPRELPTNYMRSDHFVIKYQRSAINSNGIDVYQTCRYALLDRRLADCINSIDSNVNRGLAHVFENTYRMADCACISF